MRIQYYQAFKGIFMCSRSTKKCKYRTEYPSMEQRVGGNWKEYAKGLTLSTVFCILDTTMEVSVAIFFMSLCVLNIAECTF